MRVLTAATLITLRWSPLADFIGHVLLAVSLGGALLASGVMLRNIAFARARRSAVAAAEGINASPEPTRGTHSNSSAAAQFYLRSSAHLQRGREREP